MAGGYAHLPSLPEPTAPHLPTEQATDLAISAGKRELCGHRYFWQGRQRSFNLSLGVFIILQLVIQIGFIG